MSLSQLYPNIVVGSQSKQQKVLESKSKKAEMQWIEEVLMPAADESWQMLSELMLALQAALILCQTFCSRDSTECKM